MSRPFRECVGDSTSEQIEFMRRMYAISGSQNRKRSLLARILRWVRRL